MRRILIFIMLPGLILMTTACNKKHQKVRAVELDAPYYIDYDKAVFNLSFVTDRKKNEQHNFVGICWDTEPNPTYFYRNFGNASLTVKEYVEKESGSISIMLQGLFANTTYYARGFLDESPDKDYNDENDFLYSSNVSFTTGPMIPAPCSVTPNQIDFSGNVENMAPGYLFNQAQSGDYIEFLTSSALGDFRVLFPHEPLPGVYRTVETEMNFGPESKDIIIKGHIAETYNCEYLADSDQYVYVDNDGNGNVSISFCDLKFRTQDPCTYLHELTGKVTNY